MISGKDDSYWAPNCLTAKPRALTNAEALRVVLDNNGHYGFRIIPFSANLWILYHNHQARIRLLNEVNGWLYVRFRSTMDYFRC